MPEKKLKKLQILLLALFAAMFIAGVLLGEPGTVYKKAIDLCLECIGIGG